MYEFITGKVQELKPTYVVVLAGDIGYYIEISLNTFSQIDNNEKVTLFLHYHVREDAHKLFGFINKHEREVFRSLISVSGIGANTARMMLSSMTPKDIEAAIINKNVSQLKGIKGIGAKTAQRIIVDLADKIGKVDEFVEIFDEQNNTIKNEALSALIMLGFNKKSVEKVLDKILAENVSNKVEDIVKEALKQL
ncbi:MAG: Holliday junction branch migration protein RuvA [Marinilabiliales bacterium]